MEVVVEKYTPEHQKIRRGERGIRIGSSEVPVICGLSKYASPVHLWEYIVIMGDSERETTPMMAHGRKCEEYSAELYTKLTGWSVSPGNYHYSDDPRYSDLFGCSVDRKVISTVEIKDEERGGDIKGEEGDRGDKMECSINKWEGILDIHNPCYTLGPQGVPHSDMAQIQYQLFITKKDWCDYLITQYDFSDPKPEKLIGVRMTRVYFNKKYCEEWLLPQLLYFCECLEKKVRPLPPKIRLPAPLVHTVEYSFEP